MEQEQTKRGRVRLSPDSKRWICTVVGCLGGFLLGVAVFGWNLDLIPTVLFLGCSMSLAQYVQIRCHSFEEKEGLSQEQEAVADQEDGFL